MPAWDWGGGVRGGHIAICPRGCGGGVVGGGDLAKCPLGLWAVMVGVVNISRYENVGAWG